MDRTSPAPNRTSLQNRMDHVNDKYAPCMDPTIVSTSANAEHR